VLLITHDRELAAIADRTYRLHDRRTTDLRLDQSEAIAA
jgi:ABC-type lipoprotein export system ATPase subunit